MGGSPDAPAKRRRSHHLYIALFCAVWVVIFFALGVWQVQRRHWKLALIEQVNARVQASPQDLPAPSVWAALAPGPDAYRRLRFSGRWDAHTVWVRSGSSLGWGYWVLRAVQTDASHYVWVNLGFVPEDQRSVVQPQLQASVNGPAAGVGLLRFSEAPPLFRHNRPDAGEWYSRDIQAISRAQGLDAGAVAPYFIDAQTLTPPVAVREQGPRGATSTQALDWPQPGLTTVEFANNHAMYAITWFVLSALSALAGWIGIRYSRSHDHDTRISGTSAR